MQKMSQTEELARLLAARARRHTLTPEEIGRAMDEQEYDASCRPWAFRRLMRSMRRWKPGA